MRISLPYLQFRSNTLVGYNLTEYDNGRRFPRNRQHEFTGNLLAINNKQKANADGEVITTYSGRLCPGASKRLRKAVEILIQSAEQKIIYNPVTGRNQPFQLSFCTLTFADDEENFKHKDVYKPCLAKFLRWMRETHHCNLYLWKAELQQRGQLHYHITSNVFIHYEDVRRKWNALQKDAGLLENYYRQHGNYDPPGTDIAGVRNIEDMPGYILKEITKNFQNEATVGGKVWDCSINIKKAKPFTICDYNGEYAALLNDMSRRGEVQRINTDHCTIYKMIKKRSDFILNERDRKEYNELMLGVRTGSWVEEPRRKQKPPDILPSFTVRKVNFNVQTSLFSSS